MTFMEELPALEEGLGLIPLSDSVLRFQGSDAHSFLQGMLSNDTRSLKPGRGLPAFFLNAKGKWIAALQLFQIGSSIFAKTSALEAQGLLQAIQPLILFSESQVADLSRDYQWILGIGAKAWDFARDVFSVNLDQAPLSHQSCQWEGLAFEWILNEGFRLPSFWILCPRKDTSAFLDKVFATSPPYPLLKISAEALEILRIESKIPLFGQDADEKSIPLEAGFEAFFSYTKGCYVGQETISRIKHYGRVNKRLMQIQSASPLQAGEAISSQGKEWGKISSACFSPRLQSYLALATLSSEAAPGKEVQIHTSAGLAAGKVLE